MQQCTAERTTAAAPGGDAATTPLPAAIRDALAAALEGGATMDGILARVHAPSDEGPPGSEGGWPAHTDCLIGLQRETDRLAGEWAGAREPGAAGRGALVAIETLRTLTLHTMADLSQQEEPVSTEELGRLALTLNRIERADALRIERERAAAQDRAQAERQASWASMPHDEWVQRIRRSIQENMPGRSPAAVAAGSAWAEDSSWGSGATPRESAPDPPAVDDGAQDAWDTRRAPRVSDPRGAPDPWDPHREQSAWDPHRTTDGKDATVTDNISAADEAPDTSDTRVARDEPAATGPQDIEAVRNAPDEREYSVVRDVEMRRRDRARLLWPAGAPF